MRTRKQMVPIPWIPVIDDPAHVNLGVQRRSLFDWPIVIGDGSNQ